MHTQDTRSLATTRSDRCTRYALTVRQVIRIRDHEERQVHMLEPEDTQDTRARDHEERQMYMLEPEDTQDTHVEPIATTNRYATTRSDRCTRWNRYATTGAHVRTAPASTRSEATR